ncbi:subtilisin-like protein [Lactarius hengduanensis]|nr:subtilisin-like protein [Lactarius hengduanensis]
MYWLPTLSVLAAVPFTLASPLAPRWDDLQVKHAWNTVPKNWECQGHPPEGSTIDLRIALKPERENALVDTLYEISDPAHPKRKLPSSSRRTPTHWSLSTPGLNTMMSPPPPSRRHTAANWLTLVGVPVSKANDLLGASYQLYRHAETNDTVLRTIGYSVPAALHKVVQTVAPTTYFGKPRAMRRAMHLQPNATTLQDGDQQLREAFANATPGSAATVPASCATTITPTCLRALYNTAAYVPAATSSNKLGIAGYLDEFANHADLTTFMNRFRPDAASAAFTVVPVKGGGNDQTDPGVEANLDIQYAEAIAFPTPSTYWSTGGSPPFIPDSNTPTNTNEPYLDWLNFVLAGTSIPQTISTSYGDDEQTVPIDYATSVCNLFAQLGSRGSSVFFSSGDEGVGGGNCKTNDGTNKVEFLPEFPTSSSPAADFSNYFTRPSYQSTTVANYLTSIGTKNQGLFNPNGRAYPDIAAQAQNFQVVVGGSTISVAGTSCSAPNTELTALCQTVAGVFSLLNDFLISQGKAPLGFLNPLIYTSASAFNDIKSGSNPGCGTQGFSAVTGWDPVTGFGTPDFVKLQAIVG